MKVGLLLVTYNRTEYLKQCVDTLINSDLTKLDLLYCLDDYSTEDTYTEIIRLKHNISDKISFRRSKNSENMNIHNCLKIGFDYLYNHGFDVMINIDSDVIVRKEWLENILRLQDRFPNDIISGFNTRSHPIIKSHSDYHIKKTVGGINLAFSKETYKSVIEPSLTGVDWDWKVCKKISEYKIKFIVSKPSVINHIGANSTLRKGPGHDVAIDYKQN